MLSVEKWRIVVLAVATAGAIAMFLVSLDVPGMVVGTNGQPTDGVPTEPTPTATRRPPSRKTKTPTPIVATATPVPATEVPTQVPTVVPPAATATPFGGPGGIIVAPPTGSGGYLGTDAGSSAWSWLLGIGWAALAAGGLAAFMRVRCRSG